MSNSDCKPIQLIINICWISNLIYVLASYTSKTPPISILCNFIQTSIPRDHLISYNLFEIYFNLRHFRNKKVKQKVIYIVCLAIPFFHVEVRNPKNAATFSHKFVLDQHYNAVFSEFLLQTFLVVCYSETLFLTIFLSFEKGRVINIRFQFKIRLCCVWSS